MNTLDCAMFVFWALLCVFNAAALLPLFSLSVFAVCFSLFNDGFPINCITALTYFLASQINIIIPSSLRYALLAGGLLYFVGAIDDMLYQSLQVSTVYYDVMPYLVIVLNSYIAALIFSGGGRNIVGIIGALRRAASRIHEALRRTIVNRWRLRL